MKQVISTILFTFSVLVGNAQDTIPNPPVVKELQSPKSYLDSIKKTFVNHKAISEIDKKWMKELLNDDLFTNMENDINNVYLNEDVAYDLPTDLLKARLENLNKKSAFNVQYNETTEKVIKNFLKKRSKSYERLMALSEYYFPMFEEHLAKYDVPLEIKYLAIVESALNPKAKSKVGATGLWQFMYPTGKQYGLDVNTHVDERSDPLKSTEAAVKYLKDLYNIFGSWEMVLASYNAGPGNVSKAIRRAGGETDYWKMRSYLPKETQGYVPAFIATMYIYEYHKEHNIQPKRAAIPYIKTDTIVVKRAFTFKEISELIDVPVDEIKLLNPKYKTDKIPLYDGSKYSLRLPLDKIGKFASNEKKIYSYYDYLAYYEKETARRNTLRNQLMKEYNAQYVNVSKKVNTTIANNDVELNSDNKYYTIKKGDSLFKIASDNNITLDELKSFNNLSSNEIKVGQKLIVGYKNVVLESVKKDNTKKGSVKEYVVQKGDTLYEICKKNGNISVAELMKINNLKSANDLKAGMVLKINS